MADRPVNKTQKASDGDILGLCNSNETWSPRLKADAIRDIESGTHTYHVPWTSGRTEIEVVNDPSRGKYLRSRHDSSTANNLEELPNC